MVSAGVLADWGITFDALLVAMREKSLEAVAVIAMAAQIAGISWDAYARVVPQRGETKVGQGIEFTILNPQAEAKLNALQKMWGAALIDIYPGDPYFSRLAGWEPLREFGWPARLYHRALVKAIMLGERAQLSGWETLTAALGLSGSITGSWTNTVALRKTEFEVPPADRSRIAAAHTAGGRRYRLRRYRKEVVEPPLFSDGSGDCARTSEPPAQHLCRPPSGTGPSSWCIPGPRAGPGDIDVL